MLFKNVCLETVAHILPQEIITSKDIEKRLHPLYEKLNLSYGRLEFFTGIKERRFWKNNISVSDMAAKAGKKALHIANIKKQSINCLINASVSRDYLEPSTASIVHKKIGLNNNILTFDISNACLGYLNAMLTAASMIETNQVETVLITGCEIARPLVDNTINYLLNNPSINRQDMKHSFASLTIGSGAAAIIMTHKSVSKSKHEFIGGVSLIASKFHYLCKENNSHAKDITDKNNFYPLMHTDSERLMKEGCTLAKKTWEQFKKTLAVSNKDVKHFFCHQVSKTHQKHLYNTLKLNQNKDYPTYEKLGNMASVSLPVTLSLGIENNILNKNDFAALLGIGSGINCTMLAIKW